MTSIEWLNKNIFELIIQLELKEITINQLIIEKNRLYEQAKEMHKQEIIDAYETSHISMMTSEQYYNETFKKD